MKFTSIYYVAIKGSSVYYGGKRLNHSQLADLCAFIYEDLKFFHSLFCEKYLLKPALLWHELPYSGLVAIVSRLVLDCDLAAGKPHGVFSANLDKFVEFAKFPSFLKENKKESVSVDYSVLFYSDKSLAGYFYDGTLFPSFSSFCVYIHGLFPSDKYEVEFISR